MHGYISGYSTIIIMIDVFIINDYVLLVQTFDDEIVAITEIIHT